MTNKNKRLSGIFIVGCLLAACVAVAAELASSGIFGSSIRSVKGLRSARSKLAE